MIIMGSILSLVSSFLELAGEDKVRGFLGNDLDIQRSRLHPHIAGELSEIRRD